MVVVEVPTTDGGGSGGSGEQSLSRRGCRRKEAATRPQKRRGVRGRACRHIHTVRRLYSDGTTRSWRENARQRQRSRGTGTRAIGNKRREREMRPRPLDGTEGDGARR